MRPNQIPILLRKVSGKITFTDSFTGGSLDPRWSQSVSGWGVSGGVLNFTGASYSTLFASCTAGDNTVSVDCNFPVNTNFGGIAIRYVDDNNCILVRQNASDVLQIVEIVGGAAVNTITDPGGTQRLNLTTANLSAAIAGATITVAVTGGTNPGSFSGSVTNFTTSNLIGLVMNTSKTTDTFDNFVLA